MVLQKQFFSNQDPFVIQKVNKTKKLVDFVVKALKVVIFFATQPHLSDMLFSQESDEKYDSQPSNNDSIGCSARIIMMHFACLVLLQHVCIKKKEQHSSRSHHKI